MHRLQTGRAVNDVVGRSRPFLSATKPNFQAYDVSNGFGGFFLGCGGDMGAGTQGEAGGEVAQHAVVPIFFCAE